MSSRFRQWTRSAAIASVSLQLLLLVCLYEIVPAKSSLAGLFFSYHVLAPNPLYSELGILVSSGGCVPQTGLFSHLRYLVVAAVQSISVLHYHSLHVLVSSNLILLATERSCDAEKNVRAQHGK